MIQQFLSNIVQMYAKCCFYRLFYAYLKHVLLEFKIFILQLSKVQFKWERFGSKSFRMDQSMFLSLYAYIYGSKVSLGCFLGELSQETSKSHDWNSYSENSTVNYDLCPKMAVYKDYYLYYGVILYSPVCQLIFQHGIKFSD